MQLKNFLEGIAILQKYFDDPEGYHLGAEHDIIYIYPTNNPVSEEDVAKLKELGWFQPDAEAENDDEDDVPYNPEESWAAYT